MALKAENLSQKLIDSFKKAIDSFGQKPAQKPDSNLLSAAADYEFVTSKVGQKLKEEHPYLRSVAKENAFVLKIGHENVVSEVMHLEALYKELKDAPEDAFVFHMGREGNDFASWIKDSVGDWWLGSRLEKIEFSGDGDGREKVLRTLGERIARLRSY